MAQLGKHFLLKGKYILTSPRPSADKCVFAPRLHHFNLFILYLSFGGVARQKHAN
jgi:hypothetical protein